MHDERHEMEMIAKHESGAEEWLCPVCGRRFLMQWPPAYKKIVLEAGDEYASHSCSKGGLRIGSPSITTFDAAGLPETPTSDISQSAAWDDTAEAEADDPDAADKLQPWTKWMRNANLDEHLD
jgi:hypothetical protein